MVIIISTFSYPRQCDVLQITKNEWVKGRVAADSLLNRALFRRSYTSLGSAINTLHTNYTAELLHSCIFPRKGVSPHLRELRNSSGASKTSITVKELW